MKRYGLPVNSYSQLAATQPLVFRPTRLICWNEEICHGQDNAFLLCSNDCLSMINRWAALQTQQAQTRQKYIPIVEKVLPGRKAALFFQIDRRLYALMDLQVASQIPLVAQ